MLHQTQPANLGCDAVSPADLLNIPMFDTGFFRPLSCYPTFIPSHLRFFVVPAKSAFVFHAPKKNRRRKSRPTGHTSSRLLTALNSARIRRRLWRGNMQHRDSYRLLRLQSHTDADGGNGLFRWNRSMVDCVGRIGGGVVAE